MTTKTSKQVLDKETPFDISELFFSRTDQKGRIESGNSVFVRVSQYTIEKLLGAPHNIVRHPDMPKAVFKYFWDTIKTNQPIGAYVKNLSKSGSYYWVFAVVWPVSNGYLSIRLKPSSTIFSEVKGLYAALLEEENQNGVPAALSKLINTLQGLGFKTYQDFMSAALLVEMQSRDQALSLNQRTEGEIGAGRLQRAHYLNSELSEKYAQAFLHLVQFSQLAEKIKLIAQKILINCKGIDRLSINMIISAEKTAEGGAALSKISEEFKTVAEDIERQVLKLNVTTEEVLGAVTQSQFQIGGARLQVELIKVFLNEAKGLSFENTNTDGDDFLKNYQELTTLASESSATALTAVNKMDEILRSFIRVSEDLATILSGLEIIKIAAKVEVARLDQGSGVSFSNYIPEMESFIMKNSEMVGQLKESSSTFLYGILESDKLLRSTQEIMSKSKERVLL